MHIANRALLTITCAISSLASISSICLAQTEQSAFTANPTLLQTDDSRLIKSLVFLPGWTDSTDLPWSARLDTSELVPAPHAPLFDTALRVTFPAGAVGPAEGGAQFPLVFERWPGINAYFEDITLSYCLKFEEGFDFVKGGKLPGLMGGADSWSRSGGNQPDGSNGWTLRFMWRPEGRAVVYAYLPPSDNGRYGSETWGQDLALNKKFIPGQWHCLQQRVVINDIGQENGQLQVWFDGELVLELDDITYRKRDTTAGKIGGMYFSTFHGGHTKDWAPAQDSSLLINGFTFSQ